jgi:pyrroloquinoline quinone (PQQ) biosynthesis protein C
MQFYDILCQHTEPQRQQLLGTPLIQQALTGDIDLAQYVAFLTQAYHHVKHTVPLMMACGSRLSDEQAWLRQAIAEYIEEEIGHEEWILSDIAACGGDPKLARDSRPLPATELMVAYAYHGIDRGNPIGFFGMVHVLEAQTIQLRLDLQDAAFSYLTSHGSLDLAHVAFFVSLMNRVERAADREAIIHSARMMYRLYGDIFRSLLQRSASLAGV